MSRLGAFLIVSVITSVGFAQQDETHASGEIYAMAAVVGSPSGQSAQGFAIGGAWRQSPKLSLVAEFGRHFESSGNIGFNIFMMGPRFYSEEHYRLSGFIQVLTGAGQSTSHPTDWGFVFASGAGMDIRLTERLLLRPLQVDWIMPAILRVSSGFAIRFGQ